MAFFALIIVLLFYFLCKGVKSSIAQKYYCVFVSIGLILISGLRNPAVGEHSDTDNYLHSFDLSASISWKTIFSEFFPTYFSPSFEGNLWKDPGFTVFEKIISVFTSSHQIYLVIIAILFIVPLSRFIYRNVKDVRSALFAYSYYVSFNFAYIPNSSIRQSLALSLLFFCYDFLKNNKYGKCLVVLFLASTLHKSVLIFAAFILLHKLNAHKFVFRNAYIVFLLAVLLYGYLKPLFDVFGDLYGVYGESDYYATTGHSYTYLIFLSLLYLLTLIPILQNVEHDFDNYKIAYLASSFALFLSPLLLVEPTILRIIAYFSVWNFILIPHSIEMYNKTTGRMIFLSLIGVCLYMTLGSIGTYRFFWQYM